MLLQQLKTEWNLTQDKITTLVHLCDLDNMDFDNLHPKTQDTLNKLKNNLDILDTQIALLDPDW